MHPGATPRPAGDGVGNRIQVLDAGDAAASRDYDRLEYGRIVERLPTTTESC